VTADGLTQDDLADSIVHHIEQIPTLNEAWFDWGNTSLDSDSAGVWPNLRTQNPQLEQEQAALKPSRNTHDAS
jgi:hypothetical protein